MHMRKPIFACGARPACACGTGIAQTPIGVIFVRGIYDHVCCQSPRLFFKITNGDILIVAVWQDAPDGNRYDPLIQLFH